MPCFYTNLSLFLAFTVIASSVYFFGSFPFDPPPLKKSETSACGARSDSFCSPTDLSLRFSLEGYNIFFGFVTQEMCCWNELRILTFETRNCRKPWKLKASLLVKFNISAWFVPRLFVGSNLELRVCQSVLLSLSFLRKILSWA